MENNPSYKQSEMPKSNNVSKILLTMGTGTGLSIIYPYKNEPQPLILPAECWASNLSPDIQSPIQVAAGDYLAKKKRTKASLLKFLKGAAILDLYNFMREVWSPDLYTGAEKNIKK